MRQPPAFCPPYAPPKLPTVTSDQGIQPRREGHTTKHPDRQLTQERRSVQSSPKLDGIVQAQTVDLR
jgi:hypothetical protein